MFQTIPEHATIIAPAYLHHQIRHAFLQKKSGMLHIRLSTLSSFLKQYTRKEEISHTTRIFLYYQRMKQHASQSSIYANVCNTLSFLCECETMINDMKFYQISLSQLPADSDAQQELKDILTVLYDIPSACETTLDALAHLSENECSSLYFCDTFFTHKDQMIMNKLKTLGAQSISFYHEVKKKKFYHALNMRQETEAAAQWIIEQNIHAEDVHISICDSFYQPLIQQVFPRYQIPFTILKESSTSAAVKKYMVLLNYYRKPDLYFDALLNSNLFSFEHLQELITYTHMFTCDLHDSFDHIKKVSEGSEILPERELKYLQRMEQHAAEAAIALRSVLQPLHDAKHLEEALQMIDEIVVSSLNSSEYAMAEKVQELLRESAAYIEETKDLDIIISMLDQMKKSSSADTMQGAAVGDLTSFMGQKPYHIMLGATQKNYPAFPICKGVFDEQYRSVLNLPSMEERYQLHLQQLDKVLHSSEFIIVFYPLGTYEGKGNEAALEIESFLDQRAVKYPLIDSYEPFHLKDEISPKTAETLFLSDQTIRGSISAFEMYIKCPFSYFLRYGLQLKKPFTPGFDQSRIGTLSHYVLETLVNQYVKDYANANKEEIAELLQPELQKMIQVYPNYTSLIQLIGSRLLESVIQKLQAMKDMEEHSSLVPLCTEYEFHHTIPLKKDVTMQLHGFIDRINHADRYLQILDYKSSIKSLTEQHVFSALQLQLITYAIAAHQEFQQEILGAYYLSLKNENINCSAGKMKRRPVEFVPYTKADYEEERKKSQRLQGWTMDNHIALMDDDASHIVSVTKNKDGLVKTRKVYHLPVLEQLFHTMYQQIGTQILQGNISLAPHEDACLYCDFHEICRFKGFPVKKDVLVDADESIYKNENSND